MVAGIVMCVLCGEYMATSDAWDAGLLSHRECSLREVLGGIGHLIDHAHFCLVKHDPDAGMTYRQSALLVDVWVSLVGVDRAVGG